MADVGMKFNRELATVGTYVIVKMFLKEFFQFIFSTPLI